jgi:hypothetical protein
MSPRKTNAKRTLFFSNENESKKEDKDGKEASQKISPNPSVFESPKKKAKAAAVVTPAKDEEVVSPQKKTESKKYVPKYVHKNVQYQTEGEAVLPESRLQAYQLIKDSFVIPDDFEQSRQHGPLSGSCFEERVIKAYNVGSLEPKPDTETGLEICVHCGTVGHLKVDCDELL